MNADRTDTPDDSPWTTRPHPTASPKAPSPEPADAGPAPARRAVHPAWYACLLLASAALLAGYWVVLSEGVARAHQHWAGAQRGEGLGDGCAPVGTSANAGCAGDGGGRLGVRTSAVR